MVNGYKWIRSDDHSVRYLEMEKVNDPVRPTFLLVVSLIDDYSPLVCTIFFSSFFDNLPLDFRQFLLL